MATAGFGPPRPPLPPAMEDEDDGPGDAAPADASPEDTSPAATSRSTASPTGTAPTTDFDPRPATATSRSTASSPATTAPTTAPSTPTTRSAASSEATARSAASSKATARSRSAASSTATSLPAVSPTAPAPPTAGAPQQPQNPEANGGARGEPGGAAATACSTSAQIRRRPGAAKAAALARAAGASDVPVARATAAGAPKRTALMTSKVPHPVPLRTMTATPRAATAAEGPDRHIMNRKVDFAAEFEKLATSLATIGGGLAKIFAGCGLKIVDKAEKEKRAAEEKAAAEQKRIAEQKALEEQKALSPEDAVIWKKNEEQQKKKKEEEERKEKRVAFLLAIPGCFVNTSTILHGIREIASGGRDSVFTVGTMMRGIPSVMAWKGYNAMGSRREAHGSMTSAASLGAGALGLRTAIDRQILTRAYDGSIAVIDGFGLRKQTISRNLMGTRIITTMAELHQAVTDFKHGNLSQLVDINKRQVTLFTAYNMWLLLCRQNLTGILHQSSPLPEMALRAARILEEEQAVKYQLDGIRNVASGLESLTLGLRDKLEEKLPKEKLE